MTELQAKRIWLRKREEMVSRLFAHFVSVYVAAVCSDHGVVMIEDSMVHTHILDLSKGLLHCWATFLAFKDQYAKADVGTIPYRDWEELVNQP